MIAEILTLLSVTPVIMTESGAVRGAASETAWSFKNIPYAAPPTGERRWRPPETAAAWEGERDATQWGPRCPQFSGDSPIGSEDCLQLNVWTPPGPSEDPRPVLFWIHGGSLVAGGSSSGDGERLVEKTGVVVVSINYRLGPLGYLAHPALASEHPDGSTGNYGVLDQIAALQWVRRNIAAFGGDPARVTIFGQSAGAFSVCTLLASPQAAGLFSGAIMQSGGCVGRTRADGYTLGRAVFSAAGCTTDPDPAACMRALPAEDVIAIPRRADFYSPVTGYSATIDGYALRDKPDSVIARGEHNHVPAIVGCTSEEESRNGLVIDTESAYRQAIWNLVPYAGADTLILRQYPVWDYPSYQAAYVAAASDMKYVCQARRAARALLAGQPEPVWRYVFSHALDNAAPEVRAQGAWHGADVMYVFDTLERNGYVASDAERMLVDAFQGYWTHMAQAGAPDHPNLPLWPRHDGADTYLRLDSQIVVEQGYRNRQCDFWDYLISLKP